MPTPMDELDPRLQKKLKSLRQVPERDAQQAAEGRARFLAAAEAMKKQAKAAGQIPAHSSEAVSFGWLGRLKERITRKTQPQKEGLKMANLLLAILMAVSVVFGGGAATVYASQDALPGDTLYPVKQLVEDADVALTLSPEAKAEKHLALAQERAQEIRALAAQNRLDLIPEVTQDMQDHLQAAAELGQQLAQKGQAEALARIVVMTQATEQMLNQAVAQAPEEAQPAISYALQAAQQSEVEIAQVLQTAAAAGQAMTATPVVTLPASSQQTPRPTVPAFQTFHLRGQIEAIEGQVWTVSGQAVTVPEDARVSGDPEVGLFVDIHGYIDDQGTLIAVQVHVLDTTATPAAPVVRFVGIVEAMGEEQWTVNGQQVVVTPDTEIEDGIEVGDIVQVKAQVQPDGALVALRIKKARQPNPTPQVISFTGTVESQSDDAWVIAGRTVTITSHTRIQGDIQVGDQVMVVAKQEDDGSLKALVITSMLTPMPTVLPTVTVTMPPTTTPLPTLTITIVPSPHPTHTPHPTFTPHPTHTPHPTFTPHPTHTPHPTVTIPPTVTMPPTVTPIPTITVTIMPTPHPTHTPMPTPHPTHTPMPTPHPTHTPHP